LFGDNIKNNEISGEFSSNGGSRGVYWVVLGKPEENRSLGRPRPRWEDNIRMNIQEVGWGNMDWIDLAQNRDTWWALVNCGNEPSDSIQCGEFLD
jgi:hypothetical protein